jgi:preprotein translocase subunit YajC
MDETSATLSLASRPEVVALVTLIGGIIIARLASIGVGALLHAIDQQSAKLATTEESLIPPGLIRVSRVFVFWLLVAGSVLLALRVMGIGGLPELLNSVLGFMPKLFIAFSIIMAGHLLGLFSAQMLSRLSVGWSAKSAVPRLLYLGIMAVAVVMGLQHVNVDISFVTQLVLILVGTVSAGLMLAFSLGARRHVANLLARRELSRLAVGDRVNIGGVEGNIVDIHNTAVDIATEEGIASVPAARLAEEGFIRIPRAPEDD